MVQNCVKFPFSKTNVFYKMYRFPCHCEQWKTRTAPEELMGFFVAEMLKLLCKFRSLYVKTLQIYIRNCARYRKRVLLDAKTEKNPEI